MSPSRGPVRLSALVADTRGPETARPSRPKWPWIAILAAALVVAGVAAILRHTSDSSQPTLSVTAVAAICEPGNRECPTVPVPNAQVTVIQGENRLSGTTGANGIASFSAVASGATRVQVRLSGHSVERDLVLTSGDNSADVQIGTYTRASAAS
jgi:type 1 fimbria pilin